MTLDFGSAFKCDRICTVTCAYDSNSWEVETGAQASILRSVPTPSLQTPGMVIDPVTLTLRRRRQEGEFKVIHGYLGVQGQLGLHDSKSVSVCLSPPSPHVYEHTDRKHFLRIKGL